MKTVYQTDEYGVLLFVVDAPEADEVVSLPFGAIESELPQVPAGHVARWITEYARSDAEYGRVGTGEWLIDADNRAVTLYETKDGNEYQLSNEADGKVYDGIGSIPAWLTSVERPSQFYAWSEPKNDWVLDEDAQRDAQELNERAWRNNEINSLIWLRERHRDEVDAGLETTLSNEQFSELLAYIQALRDWTKNPAFPDPDQRPAKLDWF